MKKIKLLPIAIISIMLQGCIFIAGAAAGAAAIAIVYDHRNVDSILQDQRIDREVLNKIKDNPDLRNNTHINVTSFGQVVLLTGEAPTAELRKQAEDLALTVRGIKRVYNSISIQGPASSLSQASDTWITTKIKSEMLATQGLKSASMKVVTENGTVYLMGSLTHEQESMVVDIARHTAGVQKVIKIFQYRTEAKADTGAEVSDIDEANPPAAAKPHPVETETISEKSSDSELKSDDQAKPLIS